LDQSFVSIIILLINNNKLNDGALHFLNVRCITGTNAQAYFFSPSVTKIYLTG